MLLFPSFSLILTFISSSSPLPFSLLLLLPLPSQNCLDGPAEVRDRVCRGDCATTSDHPVLPFWPFWAGEQGGRKEGDGEEGGREGGRREGGRWGGGREGGRWKGGREGGREEERQEKHESTVIIMFICSPFCSTDSWDPTGDGRTLSAGPLSPLVREYHRHRNRGAGPLKFKLGTTQ